MIIKIAIICTLVSLVISDSHNLSKNDLEELERSFATAEEYIKNNVRYEDSVILFGLERAGRSTLINYLIGNKLKGEKVSPYEPIVVIKADNKSEGPEIGIGSTSKTTIPTRWTSTQLPGLALWDTPAFNDNRGEVQEITNAFYLSQLVKNVKSLKIVLVVSFNDIKLDNVESFLSVLKSVERFFGNKFKDYFPSVSVVLTKVPDIVYDDVKADNEYINYNLNSNVLLDTELTWAENSKNFTKYLIDNNDRIALFKKVFRTGNITSDIGVNIIQTIKNSKSIEGSSLQDVHPTISDHSMLHLYQAREELIPESTMNELTRELSEAFEKKIDELENSSKNANVNEIRTIQGSLIAIEKLLNESLLYEDDLSKRIKTLISIDANLTEKVENQNVLNKLTLIKSIEKSLEKKLSIPLEFNLKFITAFLESKVHTAILSTYVRLNVITKEELIANAEKISAIRKQEIMELENKLRELQVKKQ